MVWAVRSGCEPAGSRLVSQLPGASGACVTRAGGRADEVPARGVRFARQSSVNSDRRTELSDLLLLRVARKEASIHRSSTYVPRDHPESSKQMKDRSISHTGANLQYNVATEVASRALQENASSLFTDICVNPKLLSPEAAEFMLRVAASQSVLSLDESTDASHVDLTLQGVDPRPNRFGPVLLVCTTTMFAASIEKADVEKALRRAKLWRRAVGPSFSVLPVVAGYVLPPMVAELAKDLGVFPCDISHT